jgi:hypothetical protein
MGGPWVVAAPTRHETWAHATVQVLEARKSLGARRYGSLARWRAAGPGESVSMSAAKESKKAARN